MGWWSRFSRRRWKEEMNLMNIRTLIAGAVVAVTATTAALPASAASARKRHNTQMRLIRREGR